MAFPVMMMRAFAREVVSRWSKGQGPADVEPTHSNVAETVSPGQHDIPSRFAYPAELYPLLLLGALVFIMIFPWHAVNQGIPIWDSAEFVFIAQTISERFDHGILAGLGALYFERWWRPIAFPAISAPFFLLTGGRILLSVGLVQLFAVLLLAGYIYLFLRLELSSERALIGALLVISGGWLVNFSTFYYSELLWLSLTAGTLFHVFVAFQGSSRLHYAIAGVWFGLMGAVRPIETMVVALIPCVVLLIREWIRGSIGSRDMSLFLIQLVAASASIGILAVPDPPTYLALGLGLSALLIVAARRLFSESPILRFFVVAELIAVGWHLPSIRKLYLWAQETSFGSLAQTMDQRFRGVSPLTIFVDLTEQYSPVLLLVVFAAALLGAVGLIRSRMNLFHFRSIASVGLGVLMIAPMLLLYSLTGTSDMRRIMPGMLVLYVGLTGLAMSPSGVLPRIRSLVLLLLMIVQLTTASANGLGIHAAVFSRVQQLLGSLRSPSTDRDPNVPVLDGILGLGITRGNIAAYTYCYRDYTTCSQRHIPPFEPVALGTLAKERHVPIFVHFINDLDFSKPESLAAQIAVRDFQYVLVDMFDSPAAVNRADPYTLHTEKFISLERGSLPPGLASMGCFSTVNRPICVLKIQKP